MGNITFSFGSGLNDTIFGKAQAPVRTMIERRAEAFEQMSVLKKIFHFGPSKSFGELISSMTGMDGFRPVGEGGAYPVDGMEEGPKKLIEHMTWKDSFLITREAVDDAKVLDLKKRPEGFVTGYYRTREQFGAAMLVGGLKGESMQFRGRTFDTTAADKKPLFSTGHTSKVDKKLVQSNKFQGAFSVDTLSEVQTRMQNAMDEKGEMLSIAPDTILIPNDAGLKRDVFAAIGADKDPDTSNNGFNFQFGMWNVIVWPYLNDLLKVKSGDKPWILMDSAYNELYEGACWLERVKLEVKSDVDENDNNRWKGYARFGVGFHDWRAFAIGGVSDGTALE